MTVAAQMPAKRHESSVVAHVAAVDTPIGEMIAGATETHLLLFEFARRRTLDRQLEHAARATGARFEPGHSPILDQLRTELAEYFAGRRRSFDLPLRTPGTGFQMRVWEELLRIPYGTTTSYARLATAVGNPSAVRAVARANGDNRIAIIIPCHRVIGSDGSLTGYGGGLWRKKKLLDLEARVDSPRLPGL
ncbi:MAG TPA: methylated-DNA--[protein]-cysteine S-methyltransferase [Gemmatimonadaceae bacterium]|nr:methylated-DNA--[protein]-cysteine S-methyltransferase [Gemmatimonadaceae bacterium]